MSAHEMKVNEVIDRFRQEFEDDLIDIDVYYHHVIGENKSQTLIGLYWAPFEHMPLGTIVHQIGDKMTFETKSHYKFTVPEALQKELDRLDDMSLGVDVVYHDSLDQLIADIKEEAKHVDNKTLDAVKPLFKQLWKEHCGNKKPAEKYAFRADVEASCKGFM